MKLLFALMLQVLTVSPDPSQGEWGKPARKDGIDVFARERPGTGIREMKAAGLVEAPPEAVWKVIRDYDHYNQTMPYTEDSQILDARDGRKTLVFYQVVNAPVVSKRDFVIVLTDESNWENGQGRYKVSWTIAPKNETHPKRDGYVRLKVNDGYWMVESRDDGAHSWVTYYVYTDPGGAIPKWLANRASSTAVPDVFRAIRKNAMTKVP